MQFLSKNLQDEYVGMLAASHNHDVVGYNVFDYDAGTDPLVLRGILKHKLIKRCWADSRDFYYIDSGYFGNSKYSKNPLNSAWKPSDALAEQRTRGSFNWHER